MQDIISKCNLVTQLIYLRINLHRFAVEKNFLSAAKFCRKTLNITFNDVMASRSGFSYACNSFTHAVHCRDQIKTFSTHVNIQNFLIYKIDKKFPNTYAVQRNMFSLQIKLNVKRYCWLYSFCFTAKRYHVWSKTKVKWSVRSQYINTCD